VWSSLLVAFLTQSALPAVDAGGCATDLAGGIRVYFDQGPAAALVVLEALQGRTGSVDALWWTARCRLDLHQAHEALQLLEPLAGTEASSLGNIPPWRFHSLLSEARLQLGEHQEAHLSIEQALAALPTGEGLALRGAEADRAIWMGVALAARAGEDARALELLADAPQPPFAVLPLELYLALPEVEQLLAAPLASGVRLPAALQFRARGRLWRVPAEGGLAREVPMKTARIEECPGPDLCDERGQALLRVPGVRFTPQRFQGEIWYGAAVEPAARDAGAGIFAWSGRKEEAPERRSQPPPGALDSSPAPIEAERFVFLRRQDGRTSLMLSEAGLVREIDTGCSALSAVAASGDIVVLAATGQGRSSLYWLSLSEDGAGSQPLFSEELEAWSPAFEGS